MHFDLLAAAVSDVPSLASDHKAPCIEPLDISPWVAMSALQKGIRRGDVDLALRAAVTLLQIDPARLWRRLIGIVFEDIGLGSVETIRLVADATLGKKVREAVGGEWHVASLIVSLMCAAPKCRATDDLFIAISHHHELAELRGTLAGVDLLEHLRRVEAHDALLGASLAALHSSGVRWTGQVQGRTSSPKALFTAMRMAGTENEIVDLTEQGFRRTREALPILLPFLTRARPSGELAIADDELPAVVMGRNGVPTFCLDLFSWEGKAALSRFLKRDTATGNWLRTYVPSQRRLAVLAGGLFRIEGGLVRKRVQWPCAITLRWLADSGYHGMKLTDPAGMLEIIRADLPVIDEERGNVR